MRFFTGFLAGASLIGAAIAQSTVVFFTETPTSVTAGVPVTLKFTAPGPVTIILRKGASSNLQTVQTITDSASGGSFTWTPDKTLSNGADYAFEIKNAAGQDNFSNQFSLSGGSTAAFTPSASGASAASSPTTLTATLKAASSAATPLTPSGTPSTPTPSGSSTRASATTTRTTSATANTSSAAPSNAAGMNSHSPVALILGAVVAMAYLN